VLDIGLIVQAPTQDPEWLKKCALMGLLCCALILLPIAGVFLSSFNLLGWTRAYAEARMRGEKALPPVNLSYVGAGARIFVMYLPAIGVVCLAGAIIVGLIAAGAASRNEGLVLVALSLGSLLVMPVTLWLTAFNPAMLFLHVVHGERWASARLGLQWRLVRQTGTQYLLLWIAFLVCQVVVQLGLFALLVGVVVSMTYGAAMQGAAIAEFARIAPAPGQGTEEQGRAISS
jgi:hypothetical protein